ncbi:hypothetical protein IKI14_05860 [bacterium]|nr:hypothetical protein [bacterium]
MDYEISSHVDFQFNFSDFYDFLDTLTKSINNITTSAVDRVNNDINDSVNKILYDNPIPVVNRIQDTVENFD